MHATTQEMLEQIRAQMAPESKQYIDKNVAISARLQALLDEAGMSQKQLAQKMDVRQSLISRWCSGMHNLTLRSLTALEVALGADIITVPGTAYEQARSYVRIGLQPGVALQPKPVPERKVMAQMQSLLQNTETVPANEYAYAMAA